MIGLLVGAALAGTVTDARGQAVTVDAPARIVSLGGGVTELVYALGFGDKVVGADASSTYPPEVSAHATLGYHRQVGAEGVLSLAPDLVVATTDAGPPSTLAQIEAAGVPLVVLDSAPGFDGLVSRTEVLSALLDASDHGDAIVAQNRASIEAAGSLGETRVMFIYARGGGTLNVSGAGTAAAEMIGLAGATNAVDGYDGYKPLTAESAVMATPDVLLLTTGGLASLGGVEGLLAQPGIRQTPAGQAGRVVAMDDLYLLGFGPRTGEAVQALAEQLKP